MVHLNNDAVQKQGEEWLAATSKVSGADQTTRDSWKGLECLF